MATYASANWWEAGLSDIDRQREKILNEAQNMQNFINKTEKINKILNALGEVEILKSDYLGRSSYYYNKHHNIIYEIDNDNAQLMKPSGDVDTHLRKLNSLPALF